MYVKRRQIFCYNDHQLQYSGEIFLKEDFALKQALCDANFVICVLIRNSLLCFKIVFLDGGLTFAMGASSRAMFMDES